MLILHYRTPKAKLGERPTACGGAMMVRRTLEPVADQVSGAVGDLAPSGDETSAFLQRFSVAYEFPVVFTSAIFDPGNPTLVETLARLEPDRRHRCLVFVDEGLVAARPGLPDEIRAYAAAHRGR